MGISGNTVRDLSERWQSDVLDLFPDWVSVMIGVNDVWQQFSSPLQNETHVLIAEYRDRLDKLVELTVSKVSGMVLMSPFFIEPRQDDSMRMMLDKYRTVVSEIAAKYDIIYVDTQAAFDKLTSYIPTASISKDRVHPNMQGHMALARVFLDVVGFSWD